MHAAEIIESLQLMEPALRRSGLDALYLFGSRARGDHRPDSDVDILYDAAVEDIDYLEIFRIRDGLVGRFNLPVDFVDRRNLHALVRPFVEPDLVRVF